MEALILAGGAGTRLRSVIGDALPKPMAPVAGRPFLAYLLDQLRDAGLRDVWLLTGHHSEVIETWLGSGERWGLRVSYSVEAGPLGTAGALRQVLPRLSTERCLVMNGDSYLATPLGVLMDAHAHAHASTAAGPLLTMALARVADTARYGAVELRPDASVAAFREKAPDTTPRPGLINAGIYVMATGLIATIPTGEPVSLERQILPGLVDGRALGVPIDAPFVDIGVPDSYAALGADPGAVLPASELGLP